MDTPWRLGALARLKQAQGRLTTAAQQLGSIEFMLGKVFLQMERSRCDIGLGSHDGVWVVGSASFTMRVKLRKCVLPSCTLGNG